MLSNTLKDYKKSCKSNLSAYLIKYEDNTSVSYFKQDLDKYKAYRSVLCKLFDQIKSNKNVALSSVSVKIESGLASELKKINKKAFHKITTSKLTKVDFDVIDGELLVPFAIPSLLIVNIEILQNLINSSNRILDFISVELEKSKLTGNLDFKTSADDSSSVNVKSEKLENPYPRVFTSYDAFLVFEKLRIEFGSTKDNLANYSFVYHRMLKDNLIYDDFQKLQFTYFLLNFDIKIDRIKSFSVIGKKELRESIYSKAK